MNEHPVLAQIVLGYCPVIDRTRSVIATRLTISPERPDAAPDAAAVYAALMSAWPAPEVAAAMPEVSLNVAGEAALQAFLAAPPPPHLMLEVPAFMVGDPALVPVLQQRRAGGARLAIKGRPIAELPREVLPCFSHAIIDVTEERRQATPPPPGVVRNIQTLQSGVTNRAEAEAAFERGAAAVVGWPYDDTPKKPLRGGIPPDVQVIAELINGVDKELPVPRLESIIKRDPTLGFRLLRYLNSAAFGLRVEINSFAHALMLLGYQRLRRWLSVLLASASKDAHAKPLMYAAVRRGLLMEELARTSGDGETRGEMFICGVFSLLDQLLAQPLPELLKSVPVPERVQQALLADEGPFHPTLELVRAVEQGSAFDIRDCAERLLLGPAEVNRALLAALAGARGLD